MPRVLAAWWPALAAIVVLGGAGTRLDNYQLYVVSLVAVYVIFATGYNLLMGYAGQFDVGQAASLAIGAYTMALTQARLGVPFPVALGLAGGMSVLLGLVIGVIVLRLRHFYLALVTLAFSQTVVLVLILWRDLTNGFQGLSVPRPHLPGIDDNLLIYLVIVTVAALMVQAAWNLVDSRIGRAFMAIRDSEIAASVMGVPLVRFRLMAYAVSAFYGGVAGGLLATLLSYITPDGFRFFETVKVLTMIVIGGLGSMLGSIIGPVVIIVGAEVLRISQSYQEISNGALLLGFIILAPAGIAGLLFAGLGFRDWPARLLGWRRR